MQRIRVCIYGGTDLQGTPTKFISALARPESADNLALEAAHEAVSARARSAR